ncbi:diguanylate cyclase [Mangrovibacter phragmitis]|uniref:Diguanylate cyclase n=1 Tax=Mangrovibacter phragmitis TaxID=1691903 RepID=A0A1B7KZR0_9ENTR|nr:sensor domain-containing diguanylate cyclase [Mangrovibacter phragmitis]OAT75425.1 diguanylate cyclase [Mangrovibacter phragmitis]
MSEETLKQQIQNLKKHNARLKRIAHDARDKLSAALDGTGLCLWQLDIPSGKLVIFNRRWGAMLGFQPKELNAHFEVWRDHLHPDDRDFVLAAFYNHIEGKTPFYEALHRMKAKNGSVTWVLDRGRVTQWDDEGRPLKVTGTHIDMTKEKQYEQQLARLANHDPLTGLANRHALTNHYKKLQKQSVFSIAFIDLDNFKTVNDTLGHRSGDNLLVQLARRISEICPSDCVAGRLGGDEFLLILPWSVSQPETLHLARQILDVSMVPFELDNGEATIGASVGLVDVGSHESFADAVLRADEAMYSIKHNGKSGIAVGSPPPSPAPNRRR